MELTKVNFCEQCETKYGTIQKDKKSGLTLCEFCKEDLDGILIEHMYSAKKKLKNKEED